MTSLAQASFPATRLARVGLPAATIATLLANYLAMSEDQRTALRKFVAANPDPVVYTEYTGATPSPAVVDPFPQYALRTAVPALSSAVPKGTLTLNVKDYGAVGDGVADDTAAINAALLACPEGGEVFFPPGTYIISSPIIVRRNRGLRGTTAGLWPYDTGGPTRLKASAAFVGDALVRFKDEQELYGSVGAAASGLYVGPNDQSGMSLTRLTVDGFNVAGGIDGIKGSGLARSVRLEDVTVRRCTGTSFHTVAYVRTDGLSYYPRGWRMIGCTSDSAGANGFALNLTNDTTLIDCLAVNSASHGFYVAGPGELLMVGCRAPFNKGRGYYLTGTSYGNVLLSACTTDRNEQSGVYIDCTRQPIVLSGLTLRRDGRNGNGGGGGYAGLYVSGATAPIIADAISTETGQDDDGTGTMSPQYGLRVVNSTSVVVDSGVLWGNTAAILDGGGNTNLRVAPAVVRGTGSSNSPTWSYAPDGGSFPSPADHNLLGWSFDPALAINTSSAALTSGVEFQTKIRLTAPATVSNVLLAISAAGATLTAGQSFVGLRNAAGTLIGLSADQSASFAVTGNKTIAIAPTSAGSLTMLPAGVYYVVVLCVGTTMPTLLRAASQSIINVGLAAGAFRFATLGAGLTALPAAPAMAGQAANSTALWVAVS